MELEPFRGAVQNAGRVDASHKRVTTGPPRRPSRRTWPRCSGRSAHQARSTWILRPKTLSYISLTLGSRAAGLPNTLFGVRVISSTTARHKSRCSIPVPLFSAMAGLISTSVDTRCWS